MAYQKIPPENSPRRFKAQANCINACIIELSSPGPFARRAALESLSCSRAIATLATDVTVKLKGRRRRERLIFALLRELEIFDPERRSWEEHRDIQHILDEILELGTYRSRGAARIIARLTWWRDCAATWYTETYHAAITERRKQKWRSMLSNPSDLLEELLSLTADASEQGFHRSSAMVFLCNHNEALLRGPRETALCVSAIRSIAPEVRLADEVLNCMTLFLYCLNIEPPGTKDELRSVAREFSRHLIRAQQDPGYQQYYQQLLQAIESS